MCFQSPVRGGGREKQEERSSTKKLHKGRKEHKVEGKWKERIMTKQRKQVIETYIQRQQKRAEASLPPDPAAFRVCL